MGNQFVESTPVTQALDAKGIPYRFFRHKNQIHSLEQAALERNQKPEQIIRSILFRISNNNFVMVLMAGPQQISWPSLRKYLNQSRLTMATEDEVLQTTGYQIGSVSPLGLSMPIRTLVDESVLAQEEISIGSGVRNTTIFIKTKDLLSALEEFETGNFGPQ
jgi:Cys-tRNA(Pro)/Cys-tRNA(Cys) deacylase